MKRRDVSGLSSIDGATISATVERHSDRLTLPTIGMSKAGIANWLAASHPVRESPMCSSLSKEAAEDEFAYLLTRVSMAERFAVVA